jgi:protein-tyrosine kinase
MMRLYAEGEPRRALAIISPEPGDGKTYCAANLAVTLAQLGGRTLLVDADMRGPRVHELFAMDNRAGLSGILCGRTDTQAIRAVPGVPTLFVLPVGTVPPNPLELVERPAFGLLMRELTAKFDHVVVDTPAAVYGADCAVIAARCGSALVIARKNASRVGSLQDLVAQPRGQPGQVGGGGGQRVLMATGVSMQSPGTQRRTCASGAGPLWSCWPAAGRAAGVPSYFMPNWPTPSGPATSRGTGRSSWLSRCG